MQGEERELTCCSCGSCCAGNPYAILGDDEQWSQLLDYLKRNGENSTKVVLWKVNEVINRRVAEFVDLSSIISWSNRHESELFWELDKCVSPCPFLNFNAKAGKYYCEIYDSGARSYHCTNYFCMDDAERKNFGLTAEYCLDCRHGDKRCEIGKGCTEFLNRARRFIAFWRLHPDNPEAVRHVDIFLRILQKNLENFEDELHTKLGITGKEMIETNLEPFSYLIEALKGLS